MFFQKSPTLMCLGEEKKMVTLKAPGLNCIGIVNNKYICSGVREWRSREGIKVLDMILVLLLGN